VREKKLNKKLNAIKAAAIIGSLVTMSAAAAINSFADEASVSSGKETLVFWSTPDIAGSENAGGVQLSDGKIDSADVAALLDVVLNSSTAKEKYPTINGHQDFTYNNTYSVTGGQNVGVADIILTLKSLDKESYTSFDLAYIAAELEKGENGVFKSAGNDHIKALESVVARFRNLASDKDKVSKGGKIASDALEILDEILAESPARDAVYEALGLENTSNAAAIYEIIERLEEFEGEDGIDSVVAELSKNKYNSLDKLIKALYNRLCSLDDKDNNNIPDGYEDGTHHNPYY